MDRSGKHRSVGEISNTDNPWMEYDLLESNVIYYKDNEERFQKEDDAFFGWILGKLGDRPRVLVIGGGNGDEIATMAKLAGHRKISCEIVDKVVWPLNRFNEIDVSPDSNVVSLTIHLGDMVEFLKNKDISQYDLIYFARCINHKDRVCDEGLRTISSILRGTDSLVAFAQIELEDNDNNIAYEDNFKRIMGLDIPIIKADHEEGGMTSLYVIGEKVQRRDVRE